MSITLVVRFHSLTKKCYNELEIYEKNSKSLHTSVMYTVGATEPQYIRVGLFLLPGVVVHSSVAPPRKTIFQEFLTEPSYSSIHIFKIYCDHDHGDKRLV
jgi:hypothetical protein